MHIFFRKHKVQADTYWLFHEYVGPLCKSQQLLCFSLCMYIHVHVPFYTMCIIMHNVDPSFPGMSTFRVPGWLCCIWRSIWNGKRLLQHVLQIQVFIVQLKWMFSSEMLFMSIYIHVYSHILLPLAVFFSIHYMYTCIYRNLWSIFPTLVAHKTLLQRLHSYRFFQT